jgi:hypothetical protein
MSRHVMLTALAVGAVLGIPMVAAGAQARTPARSSFAADLAVAGGRGGGGDYWDRSITGVRVALSLRGRGSGRVVPYGELGMDWLAISVGADAICAPASRGGCALPYPELAGPGVSIGAVARPNGRLELRAAVGGAVYGADGTRVGAATGSVDVAAFPVSRLGLVAGARAVVVPRYRGDRLSTTTWTLGVRVR